jgi:6-pyruvoyltetrahydropterin/6-carboxytetrahydropterin synthase
MELFIDGWTSHICFSAAHIIPHCGKCSRLHGHTYALHAKIKGQITDEGLLIDFTDIKNTLKDIANELDHHVLIPQIMVTRHTPQEINVEVDNKKYILPAEDCLILPLPSSTAEHLAQYLLDKLCNTLTFPPHVHCISLGIDEGVGQGAWAHRTVQ